MSGGLPSVWDYNLKILEKENVYMKGSFLYDRHKRLLIKASSVYVSGNFLKCENEVEEILLNFAVGYMKNWQVEKENAKRGKK